MVVNVVSWSEHVKDHFPKKISSPYFFLRLNPNSLGLIVKQACYVLRLWKIINLNTLWNECGCVRHTDFHLYLCISIFCISILYFTIIMIFLYICYALLLLLWIDLFGLWPKNKEIWICTKREGQNGVTIHFSVERATQFW